MRKLAWTLAVLALIGVAIVVTAALSLNRIIAQQQEHILEMASTAIGRPIAAKRMAVNLWDGIGVRVDQLRIGDDPRFSNAAFVEAQAVVAQAKLLPLLLHRQLEVGRVVLKAPQISLIRHADGRWNYESIGRQDQHERSKSTPSRPADTVPPGYLPFIVGRANIAHGTVTVTDATQTPPRTTVLSQIDLSVGDVSPATPISFALAAALQSETQNIRLRGTAGPLTNPTAIPLRLAGTIGPLGPQALRIEHLRLEALLTPASLQVSAFDGSAFDGTFALTGKIPRHTDGGLALKGECAKIAISKVLRLVSGDAARRIEGDGALDLDLHATGTTVEAVRPTVAGTVVADIAPGTIKDFNLVREVLGRLSNLPLVGNIISRSVQSKYAQLAADPDTHLGTVHATFHIADQRLRTDDLTVQADDFGVRATGWIGFNQEADLLGVLTMSRTFSRAVVSDIREVRFLLDDRGQIAIPFRLQGRLSDAKPQPDTGYLVTRLTQGIRSGSLKDLVGKLLGGKASGTPPRNPEGSDSAIERGLRKLFGR